LSLHSKFKVAGIGELLWDRLPKGKRVGGAPANFAHHAHQLGAWSCPVSCIGQDDLGDALCEQLEEVGVNAQYVIRSADHPTGTVDVMLHEGKLAYDIHEDVAWDHIPLTLDMYKLAGELDAVCFGSLAQRSQESRQSIHAFLEAMAEHSLKIFDINLRQSFYTKQLIQRSLELANVLKLNDEELPVLLDLFELEGSTEDQLRQILNLFDLRQIAYTRGSLGSLLITKEDAHDYRGGKIQVVDTVGAGDSFTAALCIGLLRDWPLRHVNCFANEVAVYVCTQVGATPELPEFLKSQGRSFLRTV